MSELYYRNKKGGVVPITITRHALERFKQRWFRLKGTIMTDPPETLQKEFSKARNSRVTNLNKYEKQRKKRHKQGTLFFRNSNFTFVVEDCKIVTVEISIKSKRDLNKKKGLI